jgi:hypothetical protein
MHSTFAASHFSQTNDPVARLHLTLLFLQFKHAACLLSGTGKSAADIVLLQFLEMAMRAARDFDRYYCCYKLTHSVKERPISSVTSLDDGGYY